MMKIFFETKEQFSGIFSIIELESRSNEKKVANLIKKATIRELKWLKNYEWSEPNSSALYNESKHICELRFF